MKDIHASTPDLFENQPVGSNALEPLASGAVVLRSFALARISSLLEALDGTVAAAPFRHMVTPGGFEMSAAMTNCGSVGWVSDRRGYRYTSADPATGKTWPAMPSVFMQLAKDAAESAGYDGFLPDACLINRYQPGARLTLHQDKDEQDFTAPIVSVSLGLPATFQFGGLHRSDPIRRIKLFSGDVVVWGGASRLAYHGVLALREAVHSHTGPYRINLTFRKAQ